MLANWLGQAGNDKTSADHQTALRPHPITPDTRSNTSPPDLGSRPSLNRAVTVAISTPHDAVLAELLTQQPGSSSSPRNYQGPETSSFKNEGVIEDSDHRARSPLHEPLHDPFSGSIIGLAVPDEREHDEADFESTRDELWAHMAHIRDVQSQIANMHVLMEGVGPGPGEQGAKGRSIPLVHPSEGDKWEDEDGDEEAEEKKAREQEFARLAEKFNGRKEATDNIMKKLDELSRVVTAFHALKTPTADFNNGSRTTTKQSTQFSGVGGSSPHALSDPPNVIIPPPRETSSPLAFVESPVSVNIHRPQHISQGTQAIH